MDRYDEKKDHPAETAADSPRDGDVLGLGGAPVPKAPGDPSAKDDPQSVAKRRARAQEDESRSTPRSADTQGGATSIDMGAGGTGNLIRGE